MYSVKDLKAALEHIDDDLEVIVRGTNDDEESVIGTIGTVGVETDHTDSEVQFLAIDLDCTPPEEDSDEETPTEAEDE